MSLDLAIVQALFGELCVSLAAARSQAKVLAEENAKLKEQLANK